MAAASQFRVVRQVLAAAAVEVRPYGLAKARSLKRQSNEGDAASLHTSRALPTGLAPIERA